MISNRLKIGLALGGGGARGLAHIGVIRALLRADIPIHCISGSSIGAIVGAMYASTLDVDGVQKRFEMFARSEMFKSLGLERLRPTPNREPTFFDNITRQIKNRVVMNVATNRLSILNIERLEKTVKFLVRDIGFSDMQIPLSVIATNIKSGEVVCFTEGDLFRPLVASAAIPGYNPPVEIDGKLFIDAAVGSPEPVQECYDLGADFVIASSASSNPAFDRDFENVLDVVGRTEQITTNKFARTQLEKSDIAICPEYGTIHWSEFNKVEKITKIGEEATKIMIPEIKAKIKQRKRDWRKFFRRFQTSQKK
ncbi:MAG: patatin-like phospholipase family protein [Candidatus Marinimicrobia bacterium]|nr:patatin-like phospholipase family protein [Candidatus Neomarinimicrobiota bacterium]